MKRIVGNVIAAMFGATTALLILNSLVTGCRQSPRPASDSSGDHITFSTFSTSLGEWSDLRIIEYKGHRFALVVGSSGRAICEVTDASLVKTNQATISSEYSQTLFDLGFVMGARNERDGKLGTAFSLSSERSNAWLQVVARVAGTNAEAYR